MAVIASWSRRHPRTETTSLAMPRDTFQLTRRTVLHHRTTSNNQQQLLDTCSFGTWPAGRQQHPSPARVDGTPKGGSQQVLQTPQQAPEGVWQLLCQFPGKFCDTFSSSSAEVLPSGGSSGTEALASTPLRPITPPGGLPVEFCGYPKGLLVSCLPDSACGT